jgi:hypothetical protein
MGACQVERKYLVGYSEQVLLQVPSWSSTSSKPLLIFFFSQVIYSIRYLDVHSIYGYPWPFEKDLILFHCTIIPFLPGFWAPGHSSISSCHAMQ